VRRSLAATRTVRYGGAGGLLLVIVAAVVVAAGCAVVGARMERSHAELLRQAAKERH